MLLPLGTIVNVAAILAGGAIGLVIGSRFSSSMRELIFQGLGLSTLIIGISLGLKFTEPLLLIFSMLIGGVIGEMLRLEDQFTRLGERVKRAVGNSSAHFTDGLITAFLLFCVGSMTIIGSFDEGLRGDPTLLYTKSMLDGFAAIALASTYGVGVLFSAVPLFLYQYGLTLFAAQFRDALSQPLINEVTALGGLLIMGIGINLLQLKYIRISNLLPSLVVMVILAVFFL